MATFVGIDGIRGGWVAVYLSDDGTQRFAYAERVIRLLADPYKRAMIDIPIGLPKRGYRQCDEAAHEIGGSRVFRGARWGVWKFNELNEANAHYWKSDGAGCGISMQLFCLKEKLQELNECPPPPRLLETHPELVFYRLAGRLLDDKKIEDGRQQRIKVLEDCGVDNLRRWLDQRYGTGIGRDDLIDAAACAVAARDSKSKLPSSAADADHGVIWY